MPSPKDSPPDTVSQWRRFLIAAGTSHYDHLPEDAQLPSVEKDLQRIQDFFCARLHYENALPDLKINPKKEALREALRDWIRKEDRNEFDVVVIYYTGHGDIEGDRHYLLTADSDPDDLLDTAVPTEDLARRVASSSVGLVLLLIDTCYAGSGSGDIAKVVSGIRGLFSRENVGFFVIAAARPKEEAREAVFAEALTSVFDEERLGGALQEFLLPTGVSTALNRYFRDKKLSQLTMVYEVYAGYEDPPFFPNPRYRPSIPAGMDLQTQKRLSSMDPADILLHWGPRSRGVEIDSQAGWYFTGRTRILRELVGWLKTPAADAKPQIITGAPGVGKSAVLARLVTLANPEYRHRAPMADVDPDTIPPENCISVAIHAKGKTHGDIVRAISRATGSPTETPDDLVRDLAGRPEPITIVIDALDEAREPETIADKVIQPMIPLRSIRLLIGTRKGVISNLGTDVETKYLDGEYYEPEDIRKYVKLRLLARDEPDIVTPYRDNPNLAEKVAEVVAGKAKTVYLIARLICENLIQANEVVDPWSDHWRKELPDTVSSAFGEYLHRFGADENHVCDLLLPLAYAEGEGLPWEDLWAPLASALSGRSYTDKDVSWVREKAGPYIIEALQSGQSVYRLYHQALADYFHNDEMDEQRQRQIAEALIASVPDHKSEKAWREAHGYVLQHLSTHAARGKMLSGLVSDPLYLLTADPARLVAAIDRSISPLPSEIIRVYQQTAHRLHDASIEEKASYLEFSARKQGAVDMAEQIARLPLARRWVPKWAAWKYSQTHSVLDGHTKPVSSVALGKLGGRGVVVSGSYDNSIRIWEASTGKALDVLKGHMNEVNAVALGQLGGRDVVVSGGQDRTVRIWDASTGKMLRVLEGHYSGVSSVALGQHGGREVVVSGSFDCRIRIWDASTGKMLRVLEGHDSKVISVAVGRFPDCDVIVSGSWDQTIRIWEASTSKVLKGHTGGVNGVALGQVCGCQVVVSGSDDGTVRLWEASAGRMLGVFEGHTRGVTSVALGQLGSRDVVVSGSYDKSLRLWEVSTGGSTESIGAWSRFFEWLSLRILRPIRPHASSGKLKVRTIEVLEGHTEGVFSVALGQLDDREVVVSGSWDKTVRVWKIPPGNALQRPEVRAGWVTSVASGRLGGRDVFVSGGYGKVRVWDASTGKALHLLEGPINWVNAVALGQLDGGDVLIAGCDDATIRVWDASTNKTLKVLKGHTRPVTSVALGQIGGREVIISGSKDKTIRVWDASTERSLLVLERHHPSSVTTVALGLLAGREVIVSGSFDTAIWVCDASTGDSLGMLWGHNKGVSSVAFGQLGGRDVVVSGSLDNTVRVWEVSDTLGVTHMVFEGHTGVVNSVALGQLGGRDVVVSGSDDNTIQIWELEPANRSTRIFLEAPVSSVILNTANIAVGTSSGIAVLGIGKGHSGNPASTKAT